MTAENESGRSAECYFCGKRTTQWEDLVGRPACRDCVTAAEKSMGLSREELYGHEKDVFCPYCGTKMEQGYINMHSTLLGWLLAGSSSM